MALGVALGVALGMVRLRGLEGDLEGGRALGGYPKVQLARVPPSIGSGTHSAPLCLVRLGLQVRVHRSTDLHCASTCFAILGGLFTRHSNFKGVSPNQP